MVGVPEAQHGELLAEAWHAPEAVHEGLRHAEARRDLVEAAVRRRRFLQARVLVVRVRNLGDERHVVLLERARRHRVHGLQAAQQAV